MLRLLGIVGPAVLVVQVVIVGIALAICAWVIRERREPAAPVVPVETAAQTSTSPDGAAPDGPDDSASGRDGRSELEPVA